MKLRSDAAGRISKGGLAFAGAFMLSGCWLFGSQHDPRLYTPLIQAAKNGDVAAVEDEMAHCVPSPDSRCTKDVNIRFWDGETLLQLAVNDRQRAMVEWLLAHRAKVETTTKDGMTPLHYAANNHDIAMMSLLLDHHALINRSDKQGRTALDVNCSWHASTPEAKAAAAFLVSRGARHGKNPNVCE